MQTPSEFSVPLATSTPKMGGVPIKIPNAPRKRCICRSWNLDAIPSKPKFEDEGEDEKKWLLRLEQENLRQEERANFGRWRVREKYLHWTPLEVGNINDRELLHYMYGKYAFPASQPRHVEEAVYLELMAEAILKRLLLLGRTMSSPL